MKIASIHLYRICIPFKKAFKHATSERNFADNLIVETRLEDGTRGYGEGLPREYVTGETQETVISALKKIDLRIFQNDFHRIEDLIDFLNSEILSQKHLLQNRQNNTARCALELSLLDAYCRSFQKTFWDIAGFALGGDREITKLSEVYYDGAISAESLSQSLWSAFKMKLYGFRRMKIKIGEDTAKDLKKINYLRKVVGKRTDLRVDVNGVWSLETAMRMTRELQKFGITSIEQPLPPAKIMEMAELKNASSIPLMLDESLCTLEDAKIATEHKLCDILNIRLSKCGGFIPSLKIAAFARKVGLSYQLGCMVGETGILSAAGRHFACMDAHLRYLEGSFDHFLLRGNIIKGDITFRHSGRAPALRGWGLGVQVDSEMLRHYTTSSMQIF
jgi:L-Ala-D/L-Glu epimerase / N-acetyl-D-glutamate racemase